MTINGKTYTIHDYLGEEYTKKIVSYLKPALLVRISNLTSIQTDLRNCVDVNETLLAGILTTTLFPHQRAAVAKQLFLLNGFTEGGIFGDEMGLGKPLATLVTLKLLTTATVASISLLQVRGAIILRDSRSTRLFKAFTP